MVTKVTSRWWSMAATAMVTATIMALLACGANDATAGSPTSARRVSLELFEAADGGLTKEIDEAPQGFSSGDWIIESHDLLDPATKRTIGRVLRQVQVMDVSEDGDFAFAVHATIRLADGQIQYDGSARYSEVQQGTAVAPVTGGTGSYEHASGTVTGRIAELDGRDGVFLTLDFTRKG